MNKVKFEWKNYLWQVTSYTWKVFADSFLGDVVI